jgi:hypothetical protein
MRRTIARAPLLLAALATASCAADRAATRVESSAVHAPPRIPAAARWVSVLVWTGSCWGGSSIERSIAVGDDAVLVFADGELHSIAGDAWDAKRARLNELLMLTRPTSIDPRTRPTFDRCRAGPNFQCGYFLDIDEQTNIRACCDRASLDLVDFVRAL